MNYISKADYDKLIILLAKRSTLIASTPRGYQYTRAEKLEHRAAVKALTAEIGALMEGNEP